MYNLIYYSVAVPWMWGVLGCRYWDRGCRILYRGQLIWPLLYCCAFLYLIKKSGSLQCSPSAGLCFPDLDPVRFTSLGQIRIQIFFLSVLSSETSSESGSKSIFELADMKLNTDFKIQISHTLQNYWNATNPVVCTLYMHLSTK